MRWKSGGALALPFVIGALVLRLAVAPAGDAIAGVVTKATSVASVASVASSVSPGSGASTAAPSSGPTALASDDGTMESEPVLPFGRVARVASRLPSARRTTLEEAKDGGATRAPMPSLTDPPKATIVVPAAAITRAMEKRDVGATNATAADGSPLGARLAGVSRYRTGLRDGDVVISVGGTRTPTVEAMVSAGMAAGGGGATRISGRILRGDAVYAVVVDLPQ